jgi:hypothetical protein
MEDASQLKIFMWSTENKVNRIKNVSTIKEPKTFSITLQTQQTTTNKLYTIYDIFYLKPIAFVLNFFFFLPRFRI